MRPEHVAANRLIDIALTGDRDAYRAELDRIKTEAGDENYYNIVRLANMQYRMQVKDCRYTSWRADWVNDKRGEDERNKGSISDGKTDDKRADA